MSADLFRDETRLLQALRSGDEDAFAYLVTGWTPWMQRLARRFVPTWEAAEDVVQESWIAVLAGLDGFEGRSSLRTWVFTIVARRAMRTGPHERRSLPFSALERDAATPTADPAGFFAASGKSPRQGRSHPLQPWQHDPDDPLRADALRRMLDAAISTLPPRQRQVVVARDVVGCDAEEVCDLLGLSPGHQRLLLHRGRSRVRAALLPHLGTDPELPPVSTL